MRTINELIASVPVPSVPKPEAPVPPPAPVFASYPLADLDVQKAYEAIRKLIPSDQITVDAKTRTLSAFVIPAHQTAIKAALDAMQASATASPPMVSMAYPFSGMKPEEMREQIRSIAPNATVATTLNRVLVLATAEDSQKVQQGLAAMDIQPIASETPMKVFEVDSTSMTAVETALKALLPKGLVAGNAETGSLVVRGSAEDMQIATEVIENWQKAKSGKQLQFRSFELHATADATWLTNVKRIVPDASAWLSTDGRQLTILAGPKQIEALEAVLPQLQTILPETAERVMRIYSLTKAQAARRATLTVAELPATLSTLKIVDSSKARELIVWGSEEQHEKFAEILKRLDEPLVEPTATIPKSYPLTVQDAAIVVQLLAAEYADAKISADADGTRLTVLADETQQQKIEKRIADFNAQLPAREMPRLEAYSVRGMTTTTLQTALAPLLTKAKVSVDADRNRLLVTADSKTHKEIAELLQVLGKEVAVDQQKVVMAYPLVHALPSQVKLVLDQLATGAMVLADDKLKQVVVTATIDTQAIVKATLAQIDQPRVPNAKVDIRSYEAKKLQAVYLLPTLQKLWPEMQISADSSANRIIASGTTSELDELGIAMEKLLQAPDGKPQTVKAYPVRAGDMVTLPTILTQIAPQAIVSADPVSRTVTVWGNEEQQTRVEEALLQLAKTAAGAKVPSTYLVKPTQFTAVQTSLQTLFPTMGVSGVAASGQLIVVGSPDQQKMVAEIVELLASGPNAEQRTVRVFRIDPDTIDLTAMMAALQNILPAQVRIESNATNNTILAVGTSDELNLVGEKIQLLQSQLPPPEASSSHVYQLKHMNTAGAIVILQSLVPKAVLSQDAASRTIAATAKSKEHQKIAEFLKGYDVPKSAVTYNVKPTQVSPALTALRSLFPLIDLTADTTTGQLIAVATEDQQKQIADVVTLLNSGTAGADRIIKVFQVDTLRVPMSSLLTAMQATIPPQVRLESNPANNTLMAIGTNEEIEVVSRRFETLMQQLPGPEASSSVVYPLQHASPTSALTMLQALVPRATLVQDIASKTIAATAKPHEHERIRDFLKSFDLPRRGNLETRVYRIAHGSPRGLATVLDELIPEASIYGSREEGALIVTATIEQHRQIESVVKDFEAAGANPRKTEFYAITGADAQPLARALEPSFPKATFSADPTSGGVFATATEQEHAEIAKVVENVNSKPGNLPQLKAFVLKHASPEVMAKAIESSFGKRSTAGVSFSRDAKTVFVVGNRMELKVAEQLVEQIDVARDDNSNREIRQFPIKQTDGVAIAAAIENLFKGSANPVEIKFDSINGQILVTGNVEQLKQVETAMKQFQVPDRTLEIFQLTNADPYSFKLAADKLFEDVPYAQAPSISVDNENQQVLVRATQEQMDSLKLLMKQMGTAPATSSLGSGRLRWIPMLRNSERLIEDLERLWPTLQTNPLRFVKPMEDAQPIEPKVQQPAAQGPPANQSGQSNVFQIGSRLTSTRLSQDAQTAGAANAADQRSPIVIVVGDQQWTVASEDIVALDQFQRLVESLINPAVQPFTTTGNYSVYLLRHAGAEEVSEILSDLFNSSENRRTFLGSTFSRVKVVADPRINALVVSGRKTDRKVIEELLGVFDSKDMIDDLQRITPILVPLRYSSAKSVSLVVESIYKAQMTSGGTRRQLQIPEGVSNEVAALFKQVNAQSSSPLLTVSIDDNSNAIILRGPASLTSEVKSFIEDLDRQAADQNSRRVQLLRLESTNTKQLEKSLKILLGK